ncbi:uncharacterized protein LOC132791660 [Drosophila nasuta]|uniref:uncharacterized protein LOC132791660 n=1 Tax=Drosophila nasuta TaxID=42062 RepID=UPI00295EC12A|nr:uncharacterized protein LOC132791660 [Drosophila nasuta]
MDTGRFLKMFGLIAVALCVCLASAEEVSTDKPHTHVEHRNGVDISIPGTTPSKTVLPTPQAPQAAQDPQAAQSPVPRPPLFTNLGFNNVLQNGAGSIFTRPDGRTVLLGSGGQTLVTGGDSDSDEEDDDDVRDFNSGSNVFYNSQYFSNAGYGGTTIINGYQFNIVDGGIQLKIGDKVYNYPAKDASVKSKETVDINGQQATLEYDNGNIVLQLADGTVFAKTENGIFSGNRESYENRGKLHQAALDQAARVQQEVAELQNRIQAQMQQLQANLENTFKNGNFPF